MLTFFFFFTSTIFNHPVLTSSWTQTSHPAVLIPDLESYNYLLIPLALALNVWLPPPTVLHFLAVFKCSRMNRSHKRDYPLFHTSLCVCPYIASVSCFWHLSHNWTIEMKWGVLFVVFCLSFFHFEKSVPSSLLASSSTTLLQIIIDLYSL